MTQHAPIVVAKQGAVATVTIHRPEHLNALNPDVLLTLHNEFLHLGEDRAIRVVVLKGAGEKAFVAGADIRAMFDLGPRAIADYIELGQRALRTIEQFHAPVIAAVHGYALGGGLELALACDIIVAGTNAKVGLPEVNLGVMPGFGGTQRLISRCGVGAARFLCMTGDLIGASEALTLGLVDRVFDALDFDREVIALAERIAARAPLAVASVKRVINATVESDQLAGMRREVEGFLALFATADRDEGMTAFLEKRKPQFSGR
jgi:enoyl-CoA hydratase